MGPTTVFHVVTGIGKRGEIYRVLGNCYKQLTRWMLSNTDGSQNTILTEKKGE